jgi:hypothetical protein
VAESSKVTRMSHYNDNCLFVSPEQAISDLQEFLKKNPDYDKVFLIAVSTANQEFDYAWFKGKILSSEAIAALHTALADLVQGLRE